MNSKKKFEMASISLNLKLLANKLDYSTVVHRLRTFPMCPALNCPEFFCFDVIAFCCLNASYVNSINVIT
jgi:hypothetical protein